MSLCPGVPVSLSLQSAPMPLDFRSDNTHGASPEILEAVARANAGTSTSYGGDAATERVRVLCSDLFERAVSIFPVLTGTAGNELVIASMTPADGAVLCHEDAHIVRDELNAVEWFTGGARLITIPGAQGKLDPSSLASSSGRASCLSLTETTEAGTVYRPDELRALCDAARALGCRIHLDGARFANAVASLGVAPADLTWRAGIDALVLGATKNGALGAEVIVVFERALVEKLDFLWQRSGHRVSKMRFVSAQLEAYLTNDLWLRNARHANAMARRLAGGLANVIRPVEANIVFTRLPRPVPDVLCYDWPIFGPDAYRLVTAFDTPEQDVDAVIEALR
jgi:threonine aldolase